MMTVIEVAWLLSGLTGIYRNNNKTNKHTNLNPIRERKKERNNDKILNLLLILIKI